MKAVIILFLSLIFFILGCKKHSTESPQSLVMLPLYKYYYVKGLQVNNKFIDTNYYNNLFDLDSYDTCYYNDFLIQFSYDTVLIKEEPGGVDGINSAYKFLNISRIKSIEIYSDHSYNHNFDINMPLNDIIIISGLYDREHFFELNTFLDEQPNPSIYSLALSFTEPPDSAQFFTFTVVWEDIQGVHFEEKTNPVFLTP